VNTCRVLLKPLWPRYRERIMPPPDSSTFPSESFIKGAALSALIPGLGQWMRGYPALSARILATGGVLGIITWGARHVGGVGAGWFVGLLIILPWWCLQAYGASLPVPRSQGDTLKIAWHRAHDLRYLGGLFLVTAVADLAIIVANPDYSLAVFCSRPTGIPGLIAKAQSPLLHVAIGYGFLTLRPWAFVLYMVYAGYGLLNATTNFACFGYGHIRTVFTLSLVAFTVYVFWRRACFRDTRSCPTP